MFENRTAGIFDQRPESPGTLSETPRGTITNWFLLNKSVNFGFGLVLEKSSNNSLRAKKWGSSTKIPPELDLLSKRARIISDV